jgi:hypothetical protein
VFREVPEDINEDWNWGVLVGGMASNDLLSARAFKRGADVLVDEGLQSEAAYEVAYPILYLYRHAIELYLKAIVKPTKLDHKLGPLIDGLDAIVKSQFSQSLPAWAKDRLNDFARIDVDSFAFRYAYNKQRQPTIPFEWWVELTHLRTVVGSLVEGFEKLV